MRTIFSASRYLVLIGVIALLIGAVAVFVFGGITTITTVVEVFIEAEFNAEGARVLSVEMIELIDLFLLGTVIFITSLGLYELFVDPGIGEMLPPWMSVHSLEQLKFNLVAVLVVMLIILFLGEVAGLETLADGQGIQILALGAGIALVIGAAAAAVLFLGRVHFYMEEVHEGSAEHHAPVEAGEPHHE